MVVQVLLQVGECALNLVVRVWHPLAVFVLKGKEVWQIEVKAVHGNFSGVGVYSASSRPYGGSCG